MILRVAVEIDIGKVRSCGKFGRAARCLERTFAFATPESIRPRTHDAVAALKLVRRPLPAGFRQTVAVRCAKLWPADALQLADRFQSRRGKRGLAFESTMPSMTSPRLMSRCSAKALSTFTQ